MLLFEEVFGVCIPSTRDVPGRQPACLTRAAESVRPFVASGPRQRIAPLVRIGSISKEGSRATEGLREAIVVPVLLCKTLEGAVVPEGSQVTVILHPPAVIPAEDTVLTIDFGTEVGIDDVVFLDGRIIGSRSTEVIALHTTLLGVVEAPSREDRLRK